MSVLDVSPTSARVGTGTRRRPAGWLLIALVVTAVSSGVGMLLTPDRLLVGILGFVMMLTLILLRAPVAIALLVPALLGVFAIGGMRMLESLAGRTPYVSMASWSLSVLPMFVLLGLLVSSSGVGTSMFKAARQWLWWLPGGLAVGTNVAGAGLAAVSGSTLGTSYALGRVGLPEMLRAGYDKRLAIMAVMSAGLPGQLIPPSILLVIYAGLVQAPIGPQLMAGVVPGIAIAATFVVIMIFVALVLGRRAGGEGGGREFAVPFGTMMRSAIAAWPVPVLIAIIVGGMFSGVFTATEAGAGAAFVAILFAMGVAIRQKDWKPLRDGMFDTVQTMGMIIIILVGAHFLTEMFSLTGVSTYFQEWIVSTGFDRVTFLLVMIVLYLFLGMAMDTLAMMLLTVPVLVPTLDALGIPLIFFGVFAVLLAEIGLLTPPIGMLTYILYGMFRDPKVNLGQEISLKDMFQSVGLVIPGAALVLLLMIWFPDFVMWLPDNLAASP